MPNILFRFPFGRYHGTPWGNHVNEGLVEWPPSPWRILRALVATGYSKLGWSEAPESARDMVEGLASVLPEYRLPRATASHTRHFMPTDSKKPDDRTKVFDAFARVGKDAEIAVIWAAALTPKAQALLEELVPKVSYLGRAESVVEARLATDAELPDGDCASANDVNRPGVEPIALLAPMTSEAYVKWLAEARPAGSSPATKKPKKAKRSPFPVDNLAALTVDTSFLQEHGWTQPPGSKRVFYYRPPLSTSPVRVAGAAQRTEAVDTALYALASDTANREVLPRMSRSLPQMELLHRALLSKLAEADCPELAGRDSSGLRLEGHRHASLLPFDLDCDGQLDHIVVHAPMGFGAAAQGALRAVRWTFTKGGASPLFITLVGLAELSGFVRLAGQAIPELGEARTWLSKTPFVPPRHLKSKRNTLEDQIQAELQSRGLPRAVRVEVMERDTVVARGFHRFVLARREAGRAPPAPRFFGLRIELERPAKGPIALGYGSHFGLGLFGADDD